MFRGTLDGTSVHPREVVKRALGHNAAALIFAHNHPSGVAEPSDADRRLTRRLRESLALVDIRVLDHFVVGDGETGLTATVAGGAVAAGGVAQRGGAGTRRAAAAGRRRCRAVGGAANRDGGAGWRRPGRP